jgi:hypothetical protein
MFKLLRMLRRRDRFVKLLAYEELERILGTPSSHREADVSGGAVLGMRPPTIFWGCGCRAGIARALRSGAGLYWAKPCVRHRAVLRGKAEPFLLLADIVEIETPLPTVEALQDDCVSLLRCVSRMYPTDVPRVFAQPMGELNGATLRDLVKRGDYRLAECQLVRILGRSPELLVRRPRG